jgi:hypothetical protein
VVATATFVHATPFHVSIRDKSVLYRIMPPVGAKGLCKVLPLGKIIAEVFALASKMPLGFKRPVSMRDITKSVVYIYVHMTHVTLMILNSSMQQPKSCCVGNQIGIIWAYEQSDYKCEYFGLPSERFKMVIWE